MDYLSGLWGFFSNNDVLVAISGVVTSLALLSRYTPWKWDDKLFGLLEWPFRRLLGKK